MPDESVKVAVRVRPFNQRETDRKAKSIIKMQGKMTMISNPDNPGEEAKKFSFDYSYWSHDGFETSDSGLLEASPGTQYASQRNVFDDLGKGVLDNAFEGYNCSLFAYGQTGSGKSYSMVGYGPNKGIVPITCNELFKSIESNTDPDKRFTVSFSMLEIYNEQVRDLLSKENPKGGLQVRQNPTLGLFYVQGLKKVPVGSYKEIEKRMDQGTAVRTVASTNMNATSSRAHTVVTITFDQIIKTVNGDSKKSSVMNLVDLAGSERADSTGATGDRLKEGANINKSLSALGNVISALADLSIGKKKNVLVPYRDSVLTKLLQNALGGNSKTIMIAALSPADLNYDETMGTLRYADRAKQIKNKAVINENPMDRMIRELKEENDRLKKQLSSGALPDTSRDTTGMTPEEIEKMRAQMMEEIKAQLLANQELMVQEEEEKDADAWAKQLQLARSETTLSDNQISRKQREPHLLNLNEDPMLSGVVFHFLSPGDTTIGRKDAETQQTVCLSGLSIMKTHAIITHTDGSLEIEPASSGAKIKVNGTPLSRSRALEHKDRVLFGSNHLYVFVNPAKSGRNSASNIDLPDQITWEYAQKEIAQAKGFMQSSAGGMTKDQQIAQEQVLEILPMVSEVNAISEELNKHRTFEVVLISSLAQEGAYGQQKGTRVMVKMKNLFNSNTWLWERGKFMNRRYLMQDMYQKFLDGEEDDVVQEEDPFWEPTENVLIGSANVFLQSLAYGLEFDDRLTISDYKGLEEGSMNIVVSPCNQSGKGQEDEFFVDEAKELLDKPYHFKITIQNAEIHKARFSKGIQIKYRVYQDKQYTETELLKGTLNPEFNHTKVFSFAKIDDNHLEFFDSGCITFLVYGVQEDVLTDPKLLKMTTRELRQMEAYQQPNLERQKTVFHLDASESGQLKSELLLLQKKFDRLEQKEKRMQEVCREWGAKRSSDQSFEGLHNTMNAVAFSSGTKLKTRVQILNRGLESSEMGTNPPPDTPRDRQEKVAEDAVSLYVFGEDEGDLTQSARDNHGYLGYQEVIGHYGKHETDTYLLAAQRRVSGGLTSSTANGGHSYPSGSATQRDVRNGGVHGEKGGNGDKNKGSKACVIQ